MAKRYAKSPIADMAAYEHKLEITRNYFTPDMRVLEIGCGTGTTALLHAPHVKHILATDISENMIAIAREKAAAQGVENVTFEVTSTDDLKMVANTFDMVMAHSFLHLIDNRVDTVARVYDTLKPGGIFITSTACLADGLAHAKPFLWLGNKLGLLPYVEFFTAESLEREFVDAGFMVEQKWRPSKKQAAFMVLRKPA